MRYEIRVNVSPEYHDGQMAHMWQIVGIDGQGNTWTIAHGWHKDFIYAHVGAQNEAYRRKLVK